MTSLELIKPGNKSHPCVQKWTGSVKKMEMITESKSNDWKCIEDTFKIQGHIQGKCGHKWSLQDHAVMHVNAKCEIMDFELSTCYRITQYGC